MTEEPRPVIGVVGDFSGSGEIEESRKELEKLRFIDIDRDCWDRVFQKLSPRARLELPSCGTARFSALEHFHPDEILDRIPSLSRLLEAQDHVGDPERMRRLIIEAGADPGITDVPPAEEVPPEDVDAASPTDAEKEKIPDSNLLEAILEDRSPSPAPVKPSVDPIFERFLREIGEASVDRTDYAQQDRLRIAIDRELGRRMQSILHHPVFQRLEALWRALRQFLVHVDFGDACRVRILDLSRKDLIAELERGEGLDASILYRLVVEEEVQTPGGDPFHLLLGDFTFEADPGDLALLDRFGEVALLAKVPFIAAAGESLVDLDPDHDSEAARIWNEILQKPSAEYLGLAYPRLLLRLPYGPDTHPIERFEFDEGITGENSDEYLWGNPAFAVTHAIVGAKVLGIDPAQNQDLDHLPFHVFKAGDETLQSGPTEKLLTDTRIMGLAQKGFQPVAGVRGTDTARICSFRSLTGSPIAPG